MTEWLKSRVDGVIPAVADLDVFSRHAIGWWASLQPVCRRGSENWPLLFLVKEGEDWSSLRKAGRNGIHSIVATLWIWKNALGAVSVTKDQKQLFGSVLEDVEWVFTQLSNLPEPTPSPSTAQSTSGSMNVLTARKGDESGATISRIGRAIKPTEKVRT